MNYRKEMKEKLNEFLFAKNEVFSAWEGGSAATGFNDEYSDLDLVLICEDFYVETLFEELEDWFLEHYGIKHRFRVPEPSWHGHSQIYLELVHTIPFFFIDLLIEKKSAKNRFLEPNRHGEAVVWFDKENLIDTSPLSPVEIQDKSRRIYHLSKAVFRFLELDLLKLIERGNKINAMDTYMNLLRRYALLLNLKYRPAKYDFGYRYGNRDYPKEVKKQLEQLLYVQDLENLRKNAEIINKNFHKLLQELKYLEN